MHLFYLYSHVLKNIYVLMTKILSLKMGISQLVYP